MNLVYGGVGVGILGGVAGGAEILLLSVPYLIPEKVTFFTPLTNEVHWLASKTSNEFGARAIQALHYFAKPIDRLIQIVALPIFTLSETILLIKRTRGLLSEKQYVSCILHIVGDFFKMIYSIVNSILLLANACSQLIFPIQTLYAIAKGKEAAREYFDYLNKNKSELYEARLQQMSSDKYVSKVNLFDSLFDTVIKVREVDAPRIMTQNLLNNIDHNKLAKQDGRYRFYDTGALPLIVRAVMLP